MQKGFAPIIIFFIIVVIAGISGIVYFTNKEKSVSLQRLALQREITVNFLLRPTAQDEPRVFINGAWHNLPRTQANTYIPEHKKLVACGKGGAYLYDTAKNKITYVYKEEWYPCYAIIHDKKDSVIVADSEGSMLIDLIENKIVSTDNSHAMNISEAMQKAAEYDKKDTDFKNVCTPDKKTCSSLSESKVKLIRDNGTEELNIVNAIALVGIHDGFLFYAVDDSSGFHRLLIPDAHAFVLNHNLFAYDIAKKKSIKILDTFRYDYEEMIFLDALMNDEISMEENISNNSRQSLVSVPQLKNYRRKKSPNESLNKRLAGNSNVDLPGDNEHILGEKSAPLTLIIYCDFESPNCKQVFLESIPKLAEEFKGKLKIVYRHMITRNQYVSQEAAEASECVAKTNGNEGFWKFVEIYYKKTNASGNGVQVSQMPSVASVAGSDTNQIATCLAMGEVTDKVITDIENAWRQNVGGAGTMIFVRPDGMKQEQAGILNLETLRIVINEQLQKIPN